MNSKIWQVYLSGEIHTNWRHEIREACEMKQLPILFHGPESDHDTSDNCGEQILGPEPSAFWKDHKAAKINSIHNRKLLGQSDVVIVRFGEKYRQWNAAFDAGQAVSLVKPLITLHDEKLDHALKEVDAMAMATTRTAEQVVEILEYVLRG